MRIWRHQAEHRRQIYRKVDAFRWVMCALPALRRWQRRWRWVRLQQLGRFTGHLAQLRCAWVIWAWEIHISNPRDHLGARCGPWQSHRYGFLTWRKYAAQVLSSYERLGRGYSHWQTAGLSRALRLLHRQAQDSYDARVERLLHSQSVGKFDVRLLPSGPLPATAARLPTYRRMEKPGLDGERPWPGSLSLPAEAILARAEALSPPLRERTSFYANRTPEVVSSAASPSRKPSRTGVLAVVDLWQ